MEDRSTFPPQDLAALVGSRLCHDLVSPLGAIGNGVELLTMTGQPDSPELALIQEAVADANARIRFFRIAFGAASADQAVSRSDVQETLTALYAKTRFQVTWTSADSLPRARAKLGFLMLSCAEAAMPMGGEVTLADSGDALRLDAGAPRIIANPPLWNSLNATAPVGETPPAQVQFLLLRSAAADAGLEPEFSLSENGLSLSL